MIHSSPGSPAGFRESAFAVVVILTLSNSHAGVATDGTVGPAGPLAGPDFAITADLGQQQGGNLFHSFSEFNVASTESATFSGHASVQNILSRVTSGTPSQIDGLLRSTITGANLFLINPSGVVFGPDAVLDITGSFAVTTADILHLADGGRYDAAVPANSVLTTAAPTAFGFLSDNPAHVAIDGATLAVAEGQVLSIVAGETTIGSGLVAPAGRVNLVAVDSPGQVDLDAADPDSALDLQGFGALADTHITDGQINTDGDRGGRIVIRSGLLHLEDTQVTARTLGDGAPGRGIDIDVTGQVSLVRSIIDTRTEGAANAGNAHITAATLTLDARNATGEVGVFTDSIGAPVAPGADIILNLDIAHAFVSDTIAVLESPTGTQVFLFGGIGGGGQNFINTTLDDDAATPITSGSAPFTGTFRPQQALANFAGEAADGVWVLELDDSFPPFDDGQLLAWSLSVNGVDFDSVDVGHVFNGSAIVRSMLTVNTGGQNIQGTAGFTPGQAGSIDIHTDTLHALGNPTLSATAQLAGAAGAINVNAPTTTADGFTAQFIPDAFGSGAFEFILIGSVITDGTLGPAVDLTGMDVMITSDLGQTVGNNLFHSFSEFSLAAGQAATFLGPDTIHTILARVTGPNPSTLNGTLRSDIPGAHLFLINPNGVLATSLGSVDLTGSLGLTTANSVLLGSDGLFTASTNPADSMLSGSLPSAFDFQSPAPAGIQIDQTGLGVGDGLTISIIGGDLRLTSGGLGASGGRVNLISLASAGTVQIEPGNIDTAVQISPGATMGDINITEGSELFVTGDGGGQASLWAHNLTLADSFITAPTTGADPGRGIDVHATGQVTLLSSEFNTKSEATGDAGAIRVDAGGGVLLDSEGIDSAAGFFASTRSLDPNGGRAGDIDVTADSLTLLAGSKLSVSTFGTGNGGNLQVVANNVTVDHRGGPGNTVIAANSNPTATGNGGRIDVVVHDSLSILDGGEIGAVANNTGAGGDITINAGDILLDGMGFNGFTGVSAGAKASGDAGSVGVVADSLRVLNASSFSLSSTGSGDAGDLDVDAGSIFVDAQGSPIFTGFITQTQESGAAGNLVFRADTMEIRSGGVISVRTIGTGNAGTIDIDTGALVMDGADAAVLNRSTGLFAETRGSGMSGQIRVQADSVEIAQGAQMSSGTFGSGAGGDIDLTAQTILIGPTGMSTIQTGIIAQTTTEATGPSGNLRIQATDRLEINGGEISASSLGTSQGGTIEIAAGDLVIRDEGGIFAVARDDGDGGSIHVTADTVTLDGPDVEISARAFAREIADMAVTIDISHFFDADLAVGIQSPLGTQVILFNGIGGSGDNFTNTIIDDRATQVFSDSAPPYTGRFRPAGTAGGLSNYIGQPANGTWRLLIVDTFPSLDDGVLNAWSLTLGSEVFESTDVGQIIDGSEVIRSQLFVDLGDGALVQPDPLGVPQGGNGGDVVVNASQSVWLTNGASISAGTFGPGDGGNVSVITPQVVLDTGGLIETVSTGAGNAGDLMIQASRSVSLGQDSAISTAATLANGGNVQVTGGNRVTLDRAEISAQAGLDGGEVEIRAKDRVTLKDGRVTAEAGTNGGNITIDPVLVDLQGTSQITANAILGDGGNIQIFTDLLRLSEQSSITASSQFGVAGIVDVQSNLDVVNSLAELSTSLAATRIDLDQRCAVRVEDTGTSSFTLTGTGGTPPEPGGWLPTAGQGPHSAEQPHNDSRPELPGHD